MQGKSTFFWVFCGFAGTRAKPELGIFSERLCVLPGDCDLTFEAIDSRRLFVGVYRFSPEVRVT